MTNRCAFLLLVAASVTLGLGASTMTAQVQEVEAPNRVQLPDSVPLSDVEIRWQSGGGDGCPGDCTFYRITIGGDGFVTLEDLDWGAKPPKAAPRRRSIPSMTSSPWSTISLQHDFSRRRSEIAALPTVGRRYGAYAERDTTPAGIESRGSERRQAAAVFAQSATGATCASRCAAGKARSPFWKAP